MYHTSFLWNGLLCKKQKQINGQHLVTLTLKMLHFKRKFWNLIFICSRGRKVLWFGFCKVFIQHKLIGKETSMTRIWNIVPGAHKYYTILSEMTYLSPDCGLRFTVQFINFSAWWIMNVSFTSLIAKPWFLQPLTRMLYPIITICQYNCI